MGDDIVLGIDLGTTNSVVAVADAGRATVLGDLDGQRLIPSVVSFVPSGEVLVGELARERRLIDASNTIYAVKRLIGRPFDSPEVRRARERFAFEMVASDNGGVRVVARGETWALAEISAFVLRECRRIAEQMLGTEVKRAVITVPAAFNELQRSATKAAATVAGLDVVRILNEPTAAAVAYGCGASGRERVVVYDFGGGTFDVTVLDLDDDVFEVVATAGDTFLGGEDIDLLVAERIATAFEQRYGMDPRRDRQAFERLRAAGEWMKCRLSVTEGAVASLPEVLKTEQGEPLGLELEMSRADLEEILSPLVARSIEVSAKALEMAKLTTSDIDTVVLVGGSTRIPLIAREVERFFGKKPKTSVDPDLVVALGAAVQGYALSEKKPRRTITIVPRLTAENVAARLEKKEAAKRARPAQPAFAQAYLPPLPPRKSVGPPQKTLPFSGANDLHGMIESLPPDALESIHPSEASAVPPPPSTAESVAPERLDRAAIATALFAGPAAESAAAQPDGSADDGVMFLDDDTSTSGVPPDWGDLELVPSSKPPSSSDPYGGLEAIPSRAPLGESFVFGETSFDLPEPAPAPAALRQAGSMDTGSFDLPEPVLRDAVRPGRLLLADLLGFGESELPPPVQSIEMRTDDAPVLMDVTPLSLGIETAGGFTERVIRQNSPVPIEQTRMFTTAQDGQETVRVAVCQGESRVFADNQPLGELELSGIPPARRGVAKIQVTFMLDADGLLDVDARDDDSGKRQSIQIRLVGGHGDDELAQMRARQEPLAPTE